MDRIIQCLLATEQRLVEIQCAQENDPLCQEVARYCREGWPEKGRVKGPIKRYYSLSSEISIIDSLLLWNEQLIIPAELQKQISNQNHTGHQGITKCHDRARQSVWWPGLSTELEILSINVASAVCIRHRRRNL